MAYNSDYQRGNDRPAAVRVNIDNVTPDLFSDTALRAASACSDKICNKAAQIRRFYDELVMWYDKVYAAQTDEERAAKFDDLAPYIQMLRAKVAYAKGRKLVNDAFCDMFSNLISQVKTPKTLKNAKLFMEAFLGFKKYLEN